MSSKGRGKGKSRGRHLLPKILADPAKRRLLMAQCIVAGQAREGVKTTMKQALKAYDKVQQEKEKKTAAVGVGRPPLLTPCPFGCGLFSAREMRKHLADCPRRGAVTVGDPINITKLKHGRSARMDFALRFGKDKD